MPDALWCWEIIGYPPIGDYSDPDLLGQSDYEYETSRQALWAGVKRAAEFDWPDWVGDCAIWVYADPEIAGDDVGYEWVPAFPERMVGASSALPDERVVDVLGRLPDFIEFPA